MKNSRVVFKNCENGENVVSLVRIFVCLTQGHLFCVLETVSYILGWPHTCCVIEDNLCGTGVRYRASCTLGKQSYNELHFQPHLFIFDIKDEKLSSTKTLKAFSKIYIV